MSDMPPTQKKEPILPPSRIVLIIFVIAAAVVIFIELRARLSFSSTNAAITDAFDKAEDENNAISRSEVEELTSGSPEITKEGGGWELMTWSGVMQKYQIRLKYTGDQLMAMGEQED